MWRTWSPPVSASLRQSSLFRKKSTQQSQSERQKETERQRDRETERRATLDKLFCTACFVVQFPTRLIVNDVVVLLDRGQGGRRNIEARGKRLHSVITLTEVCLLGTQNGKEAAHYFIPVQTASLSLPPCPFLLPSLSFSPSLLPSLWAPRFLLSLPPLLPYSSRPSQCWSPREKSTLQQPTACARFCVTIKSQSQPTSRPSSCPPRRPRRSQSVCALCVTVPFKRSLARAPHTHTTLTCTHHVRVQVCRLKHEQRCARTPSGLHSSTSWSVERYLFATLIVVMVEEHRHRIHTTLEQPFPTTHAGAKEDKLVRGCRCHR